MDEGYHCVICGRFLPADEDGVIVHDDIPHPPDMTLWRGRLGLIPPPTLTAHCFFCESHLERFAALVAAAAQAEEREACARVCESMSLEWEDQPAIAQAELATLMDCALAIRSRSNP